MKFLLLTGLVASFLPIWRAAGRGEGMSFWDFVLYISSEEHRELHITYENAVEMARTVWTEKHG